MMSDAGPSVLAHLERIRGQLVPELELLRPLGRGSVARVYLAREPALERLVAVKVLRDEVAADEIVRLRFEREAQAAARIGHPNVTTVYRVGRVAEIPFIVMEYVEGRTLADLLAVRDSLELAECRRILASTAYALSAAHQKGIVHRDVRPGNIMLEEGSGRVVLMDFGIAALLETGARQVARLTAAGARLGDPLHMSPEQLRGEPAGTASDVYGLGILAYELLLGSTPIPERALAAAGSASGAGPPAFPEREFGSTPRLRPIQELRPDVDAELARVLDRCLAVEPQHRPRAAEVAESLVRAPATEPQSAVAPAASRVLIDHPAVRAVPGLADFLAELARRKVGRTAITYLLAASIPVFLANSFSHVLPGGEGGTWHRLLLGAIILGFPLILVLSWMFDVSSEGIRRERAIAPAVPVAGAGRRLLLPVVALILTVVVAVALWLAFS